MTEKDMINDLSLKIKDLKAVLADRDREIEELKHQLEINTRYGNPVSTIDDNTNKKLDDTRNCIEEVNVLLENERLCFVGGHPQ